jgi:S-adenosylmethionine:tRNA ribosyltransferase-isomerase
MLRTDDLDYHLPESLIATEPAAERDLARLLAVDPRRDAPAPSHRRVRDLPDVLRPGDLIVVNTTKVIPARFTGRRADSRGRVEGLFLEVAADGHWRVMLKSNGRLRPGVCVHLLDASGQAALALTLGSKDADQWSVQPKVIADSASNEDPLDWLDGIGRTPLPPYILRARRQIESRHESHEVWADELDRMWYQTVYASDDQVGAVAAPTAGLHFTDDLLSRLEARGVQRAEVVLHVGAGTFKPVEAEHVEEHPMHTEQFVVPSRTMRAIIETRASGGRVIAVGTTTARALESVEALTPERDIGGSTQLLITPGYRFRHLDGLMTNFHLPRSTLLAMVAALFADGVPRLLDLYREAIDHRYRFYSYGDAMLILPGMDEQREHDGPNPAN